MRDPPAGVRSRVAIALPRCPGAAGDYFVAELRPYHARRNGRPDPGYRCVGGDPNDHELHVASYRRTTKRSAVTETTSRTCSDAPSGRRATRPSGRTSHVPVCRTVRSVGPIACPIIFPSALSSKEARPREGGKGYDGGR